MQVRKMGKYGCKGPLGGCQRGTCYGDEDYDASDASDRTDESEALADDLGHGMDEEARDKDLHGYTPTP